MSPGELRAWRLRLGLTQGELADRLGVHRRTVVGWEMGRSAVPEPVARIVEWHPEGPPPLEDDEE